VAAPGRSNQHEAVVRQDNGSRIVAGRLHSSEGRVDHDLPAVLKVVNRSSGSHHSTAGKTMETAGITPRIVSDPEIMRAQLTIRGMRPTAEVVLQMTVVRRTLAELFVEYFVSTREDVLPAGAFAAEDTQCFSAHAVE
jgi:uncharacterized protein (DUF433 family)